jgi:xylulokinase
LLGIDIGTTGSKAVIFNEEGKVLASEYREYPLYLPGEERCELEPQEVWRAIKLVIQSTSGTVEKSDPVGAVGISTLGDSVTPIDEEGNALARTVIGIADRRAVKQASWIVKYFGRKAVFERSGTPLHAFCTIPKVMWFRDRRSEIYNKTWKFTGWQEIIHLKMGLEAAMDYSLASHTVLMDIHSREFFHELLQIADISSEKFFPLKASNTIIGTIKRHVASELGLSVGTSVVTGGFDQACCALGAGVLDPEMAALTVGTVEAITGVTDRVSLDTLLLEGNYGLSFHVIKGLYIALALIITSGAVLRWYRDTLGVHEAQLAKARNIDPYDMMIELTRDRPARVFVIPYFAGAGTPWLDSNQSGTIFGLKLDTDRAEILKGILDCLCYEVRLNLECLRSAGLSIKRLRAIGGGARSKRWMQLKADITGVPVETIKVTEAGCLGAAFLAGQSTGVYSSPKDILDITAVEQIFEPRNRISKVYEEPYQKYKELRTRLQGLIL